MSMETVLVSDDDFTSSEEVFPVKPNDWVQSRWAGSPEVATVRNVYLYEGNVFVDLVLYDRFGRKIGRASPPEGGPRDFEPACPYSQWRRISKPDFPMRLQWVARNDGSRVAEYVSGGEPLEDRRWVRARRRGLSSRAAKNNKSDNGMEIEAAAMRIAAGVLRDQARVSHVDALMKKADELESEAERLMRPLGN